jgi:hypothetical protein
VLQPFAMAAKVRCNSRSSSSAGDASSPSASRSASIDKFLSSPLILRLREVVVEEGVALPLLSRNS